MSCCARCAGAHRQAGSGMLHLRGLVYFGLGTTCSVFALMALCFLPAQECDFKVKLAAAERSLLQTLATSSGAG